MTTRGTPGGTPLVRQLAAAHAVDLTTVEGTGVGGRIRAQDVLRAAGVARDALPGTPSGVPAAARTPSVAPAAARSSDGGFTASGIPAPALADLSPRPRRAATMTSDAAEAMRIVEQHTAFAENGVLSTKDGGGDFSWVSAVWPT